MTSQTPPTHSFPATDAAAIARMFGDDGLTWEAGGVQLSDACKALGATRTHNDVRDLTRYLFADGSAIVAGGEAWDIEGPTPFSWEGDK